MPKRIDISRFEYHFQFRSESEYIHKYYIPRALQKEVTRQDVAGLCSFYYSEGSGEKLSRNIRSIVSKGAVIFYTDLCCEKSLSAAQAAAIFTAVKAYDKDRWDKRVFDEELHAAQRINKRLARLETRIKKECISLNKSLQERLAKGDKFLKDYEIEVEISYYMDRDHPEYYEDVTAEIMMSQEVNVYTKGITETEVSKKDYWGIGDRKNHNDAPPDYPLSVFRHCYLFHELFSHSPVPLKHFSRIGDIWTDIRVDYQNVLRLRRRKD